MHITRHAGEDRTFSFDDRLYNGKVVPPATVLFDRNPTHFGHFYMLVPGTEDTFVKNSTPYMSPDAYIKMLAHDEIQKLHLEKQLVLPIQYVAEHAAKYGNFTQIDLLQRAAYTSPAYCERPKTIFHPVDRHFNGSLEQQMTSVCDAISESLVREVGIAADPESFISVYFLRRTKMNRGRAIQEMEIMAILGVTIKDGHPTNPRERLDIYNWIRIVE